MAKHNEGKKLGKRRERLQRRQMSCNTTRNDSKVKNPLAYRMPGSMKGK